MWSDIVPSEDLLGHSVHASLLKEIVSNEKNLPLIIGLYVSVRNLGHSEF